MAPANAPARGQRHAILVGPGQSVQRGYDKP